MRRASATAIVLSLLVIAAQLPLSRFSDVLLSWSRRLGLWGALLFVGLFVLLTVFSLPVWQMPLAAGALFGFLWGSVLASVGCVAGAGITFLIGRKLGHTRFRKLLERSPRMRALEHAVTRGSWKVVAAVRLSHLLPFGMQNYAFSLTGIRLRTFLVTTWLITLPGTMLQAYLGDLGFQSLEHWQNESAPGWQFWAIRVAGLTALAVAVAYIAFLVRTVYVRNVRNQLERTFAEECQSLDSQSSPWNLALAVITCVFVIAAVWSVVERDAIHRFFESAVSGEW